ncbi:MAG: hypothetical protein ACI9V8_001000, partial [Urechidicola sp.]
QLVFIAGTRALLQELKFKFKGKSKSKRLLHK